MNHLNGIGAVAAAAAAVVNSERNEIGNPFLEKLQIALIPDE